MYIKIFCIFILISLISKECLCEADNKIHHDLLKKFETQDLVNVIIRMKQRTNEIIDQINRRSFASDSEKVFTLMDSLQKQATKSQEKVFEILKNEGCEKHEQLWVSNEIYVPNASRKTIMKLREEDSVLLIREEKILNILKSKHDHQLSVNPAPSATAIEWGVIKVKGPEALAKVSTNRNPIVLIGSIDTGVRGTHEAVKSSFTGYWSDPTSGTKVPTDTNGHGTHTLGTILGVTNGIGVAPGITKWTACRGCDTNNCAESALKLCGQFMLCVNKVASGCITPKLVSNSWGGGPNDPFYVDVISAWHAAKIVPIFANGNTGPKCKTASSPGDYPNVIGVGAIDTNNILATFSSRGPSTFQNSNVIKPDVVGPGVAVKSAWKTSDKSYNIISGTSMATPHVSGVVAILFKKNPNLTYDQIKSILIRGVNKNLSYGGLKHCQTGNDPVLPNNDFGYGLVDADFSLTFV